MKSVFVCQKCSASFFKWQGQCSDCGEWNSLVEEIGQKAVGGSKKRIENSELDKIITKFSEVKLIKSPKKRLSTYMGEMDRVLGGGLVAGSVVLIGGEPGIGKSTLLTQISLQIILKNKLKKIMYVCGEESPTQISLRINRFLEKAKKSNELIEDQLTFITSNDVDQVIAAITKEKPELVIIDSVQTLKTSDLSGTSGSVGQVRECTDRVINAVKRLHIATFLVGHVTKEGSIAGPKVLEHMVDAVLELTGERMGELRLIRALKNRFGATDEVGVFQLADFGLISVDNPNKIFLESQGKGVVGGATVCILEGTRPLLVEVQALVVNSQLAMPRRVGRGIELSRIQVLSAVLQKHSRLPLGTSDIFLSAAGGFKIKEPAVDLGLAVAIASSLKDIPVVSQTVFIGEIGLLGEIRAVSYLDRRIKETKRLGFSQVISRQTHKNIKEVLRDLRLG
jgi:DNA repair protein RadA/Sms